MNKLKKYEESYGSVPLGKIKRAIHQIEVDMRVRNLTAEQLDEVPVTFEYLIGSFFPEVVENVHKEANIQYTRGYMEGRKSMEEELNGTTGNDC